MNCKLEGSDYTLADLRKGVLSICLVYNSYAGQSVRKSASYSITSFGYIRPVGIKFTLGGGRLNEVRAKNMGSGAFPGKILITFMMLRTFEEGNGPKELWKGVKQAQRKPESKLSPSKDGNDNLLLDGTEKLNVLMTILLVKERI